VLYVTKGLLHEYELARNGTMYLGEIRRKFL